MNFVIQHQRNLEGRPRPRLMQDGDLVIVYERHDCLDHCYLKAGDELQNKFGRFLHNDMIGKPFGTKIQSRNKRGGYVYVLEPTPELWSSALHVSRHHY